jgi:RHS repeat-associated protein
LPAGLVGGYVTLSGTGSSEKNITKYFYNNGGIQTKMETGLNSANDSDYMTTNYAYDAWGHLVRTTDSTGYNSGTTTYDLNGNVLTVTDANGNVTTNTYDALNRVLTVNTVCDDSTKNVSKSYTYNNMGWVTNKSSNGTETSIEYDALGRVTKEWGPNFKGYFYEGVSNYVEKQLVGYAHLLLYSVTNYEYDAEMRIVKVLESNTETASYTYDANGNKTSETQANGVVSTYTYNSANKITNLITKSSNSTISEYEYSYYLDGSDACKVRKESGIIETRSYEYDGLKRLTEEAVTTGSSTDTYAYEYDDYGNRSKMTATGSETYETVYDYTTNGKYTALLQKETKTVDGTSEEIVANGLATSPADLLRTDNSDVEETVYTYDANGNQITKTADGKTETSTYDGLNQLIGFTDGETTASYTYDVDGLRLSKTVDGKTTKHVWDGNQQLVADVLDSELYSANCYLRGTNLVATYSYQNGEKTGYTYYTQNAHGDVVNLTDSTGEITKSYTYDAFGVEKNIDDSDTNAFRYCGEYYDSESGTIYLRARYYDPSTGRFVSRDSYAGKNEDPLSLNRYTYCHNNPTNNVDPNGKFAVALIVGTAAAAAVVACGAYQLSKPETQKALSECGNQIRNTLSGWKKSYNQKKANLILSSVIYSLKVMSYTGIINSKAEEKLVNNDSILQAKKSKSSGKERATDIPSWARGKRPLPGESGNDFARRVCDEKYGPGNYEKGPGTDYNKLRKYGDRAFK